MSRPNLNFPPKLESTNQSAPFPTVKTAVKGPIALLQSCYFCQYGNYSLNFDKEFNASQRMLQILQIINTSLIPKVFVPQVEFIMFIAVQSDHVPSKRIFERRFVNLSKTYFWPALT